MLKYGMRGHDIAVCQPMESAFSKMESLGITRIQLAMDKTISDFDFSVGSYTQEKAERIRESLFRHHIELPVLSCYINPADPNEGQRNQAVARFIETMRYAKVLGAGLVGTETGRAASDMSITPLTESEDCYQRMLRSFSKIAEEAERLNVRVGVERWTASFERSDPAHFSSSWMPPTSSGHPSPGIPPPSAGSSKKRLTGTGTASRYCTSRTASTPMPGRRRWSRPERASWTSPS